MKLILSFFLAAMPALLFAQAAQAPAAQPAAPSPAQGDPHTEENYLERITALKGIDVLRAETQRDIRKLSVLVQNFGAEVPGADAELKKLRDSYEEASILFYRQQYVQARKVVDQVRTGTSELFKKFSENMAKRTDAILEDCAKSVSAQELTPTSGGGNETEWSTGLIMNQSRLRTAYAHVAEAKNLVRDKRYGESIDHYRLAKLFGVLLLKNNEEDVAKQKAIEEKYKSDYQDAMGTRPTPAGQNK